MDASVEFSSFREIYKDFVWRSVDQRKYHLWEMEDRHLVYSMRMIFNNFFKHHGLDPVPGGKAWTLVGVRPDDEWINAFIAFMWEIENYRELKGEYAELYGMMKLRLLEALGETVVGLKEIKQEIIHQFEEPPEWTR